MKKKVLVFGSGFITFSIFLLISSSGLTARIYAHTDDALNIDTMSDCSIYAGPLDTIPPFSKPAKKKWRHWQTGLLVVNQGKPYHMVHDVIMQTGRGGSIVGKFDYGSVFHKDLEDEEIYVYIFGTGQKAWHYLGLYRTDYDGKIYVPVPEKGVGEYMIKMVAAGDLTEANGYLTIVDQGRKTIVFDIDGTLTLNDFEAVGDYLNVSTARAFAYAAETVNLYRDRGYQIIFLTARPYWVARDTREWYAVKGLPKSVITHFSLSNKASIEARSYKEEYLDYLINDAGLNIISAYGNAQSDIDAYAYAGIPLSRTFIIGDLAGADGTVPMYGDYTAHYSWLLDSLECCE